jgi:hypothetical protein
MLALTLELRIVGPSTSVSGSADPAPSAALEWDTDSNAPTFDTDSGTTIVSTDV